jgi:hypothetical protein
MADDTIQYELEATYVDIKKDTTQTQVLDAFETLATPRDCIEWPLAPERLANLSAASAVRRTCIEAIALNSVGLGYTIGVHAASPTDAQPDAQNERIREATDALEAVAKRDTRMNRPSFTELMKAVKSDEEEVGQGFIEVSRDQRTGLIDGLYQLTAKRMRRRAQRDGWVLLPPDGDADRGVVFSNFGEKVTYADGKPTNSLAPGASWARNECLVFRLYTSESRDYGLPRDTALVADYLADKFASESNVSFFDSSGTPPTLLFVQGVEDRNGPKITFKVPEQTTQRIAQTLRSDAGHKHRVAVIPLPPGTDTKSIQLGETSDRDMGFNEFRQENAKRTLGAFRLQPIFVPVVDTTARYDAEVQRAITLEQVFDPEQKRYEERVTSALLNDLGFDGLAITFKRLAVEADAARREAAERMAEVQAITNGEFREAHGYKPLPEGGEIPSGWNQKLVELPAAAGGGAAVPGPPGAENRVNAAQDQRGLRPGIGGRTSRNKATGQPRHVEAAVAALAANVRRHGAAQRQRVSGGA